MSIDSYSKLQSAVAWYSNRDDIFAAITNFSPAAIDSAIQIAIASAEVGIDADIASRGGIKYAETVNNSLSTTGAVEFVALPAGFKSVKSFMLTTTPFRVLTPKTPNDLFGLYPNRSLTGYPEAFAIVGSSTAYFGPVPDGSYTLRLIYNASLVSVALSSTNASNWLLANNFMLYIDRAMYELCIMMENDERLQFWKGKYDQDMDDFMGDDRMTRWTAVDATPRPIGSIV